MKKKPITPAIPKGILRLKNLRKLIEQNILNKPKLRYPLPPRRKRNIENEIAEESILTAALTGGNALTREDMISIAEKMACSINKYMAKGYSLNINLPKES